MQNGSASYVNSLVVLWDKDGNIVGGGNPRPTTVPPNEWGGVGWNDKPPDVYDGLVKWRIVFSDLQTGMELTRYEASARLKCPGQ